MSQQDSDMQDAGDADADASGANAPLLLSDKERRVLELYDRLQELDLEIALLAVRGPHTANGSHAVTKEDLRAARERFLESRASYTLRNEVVNSVIMVNPIIKAVHRGTDASPIERDLLPHIEQRDAVSGTVAKQDSEVRRINDELTAVQVESVQISRRNVDLASKVLQLAEAAERTNSDSTDDPAVRKEISKLEAEVKASRQRWKIMKGTASAVVVGSGIDWVANPELRDVVLDPD